MIIKVCEEFFLAKKNLSKSGIFHKILEKFFYIDLFQLLLHELPQYPIQHKYFVISFQNLIFTGFLSGIILFLKSLLPK